MVGCIIITEVYLFKFLCDSDAVYYIRDYFNFRNTMYAFAMKYPAHVYTYIGLQGPQ